MLLLYGTGRIGERCIRHFLTSGMNNIILTDSDEKLWNSCILGLKVLPLTIALKNVNEIDSIMVCTDIYYFEICVKLVRTYKVPLKKIISWREINKKNNLFLNPLANYIIDGIRENNYSMILDAGIIENIYLSHSLTNMKTKVIGESTSCFPLLDMLYDTNTSLDKLLAELVLCTNKNFKQLLDANPTLYKAEWWIRIPADYEYFEIQKIWNPDRISLVNFPCSRLVVIRKDFNPLYKSYAIYVAAHIDSYIKSDHLYHPLYIGNICKEKESDKETIGENINKLNPFINEYTAIFWIWKNSNSDIVGMNHYRRYFYNDSRIILGNELNISKIDEFMKEYDIILPRLEILNTTVKENIILIVGTSLYNQINSIIYEQLERKYQISYLHIHNSNIFYSKAMFITRKEILNEYCTWVFPILFTVLNKIDMNRYEGPQKRAVGYFAETMWTVWLLNTNYKIKELWIDPV